VADVDAVFAQFKSAAFRSQVEETDSATHYDLGVAYKEMGLVSDALKEFSLAARDPARDCMWSRDDWPDLLGGRTRSIKPSKLTRASRCDAEDSRTRAQPFTTILASPTR